MTWAAALLLPLLLLSAVSAQDVVQLKAPKTAGPDGRYKFPLELKLSTKREGDKAVGTATVTNPLNATVKASACQVHGGGHNVSSLAESCSIAFVVYSSLSQR